MPGADYRLDMGDAEPLRSIAATLGDPDSIEAVTKATPRELLTRRPPRA